MKAMRQGDEGTRRLLLSVLVLVSPGMLSAQTIAITGGTVYPVSGPRIERGTVLIQNGRVAAVGANVTIPAGAVRVDATGKWVTPGLIHAGAGVGLNVSGLGGFSERGVQGDVTPSFSPAEGFNPAEPEIAVTRTGGITTGVMAPSGAFMPGRAIAVDLAGDRLEDMVISPGVALIVNLGGQSRNAGGGSRAGTMALIRRLFADAQEYDRRRADYRRDQIQELAAPARELEALLPALRRETPVVINASREMDIRNALRLVGEFRLRAVLAGASEGWKVAAEIAQAGVPVALNPTQDIPSFEGLGARLDNATLLREAGVEVIIAAGDGGGERGLRYQAGNAVRNGMSWDDALRSITLAPATAFGLGDRYGSLEAGKVANVVIWSGDPLDFVGFPEKVYVRGAETSLRTRETELLERYRQLPVVYR